MANKLTFGDYAKKLRMYAKGAERFGDSVTKDVARTVLTTLVTATPVDTSRAKSNWQVGLGSIPTQYKYPKPLKPASRSAGGSEALSEGYSTIAKYVGFGILYITNNAPYIKYLNTNRPSAQAPPGFIESAMMNAREAIRSRKKGQSSLIMGVGAERLGADAPIQALGLKPPTKASSRKRGRR
jgi:hypothetical protein